MDYKEQYKSPKWQKKRLSILERDNYTCQVCGETEIQLHVHHKEYIPNIKVWDYPNNNFVTLCKNCHKYIHLYKNLQKNIFLVYDILSKKVSEKEVLTIHNIFREIIYIINTQNKFAFNLKLKKKAIKLIEYLVERNKNNG